MFRTPDTNPPHRSSCLTYLFFGKQKYDYLYKANDKDKGGSVYLQAKVTNAKIRLEEALKKGEKME